MANRNRINPANRRQIEAAVAGDVDVGKRLEGASALRAALANVNRTATRRLDEAGVPDSKQGTAPSEEPDDYWTDRIF